MLADRKVGVMMRPDEGPTPRHSPNRRSMSVFIALASTLPTSTIVVLMKPSSIFPLVNAVTKLSKWNQFSGASNGPVCAYSGAVLRLANSRTDSGSSVTTAATMRLRYFAVVALTPRTRWPRRRA